MSASSPAGDFLNLGGKVALVTGGNRGIGLAIARDFARYGAHVAIVNRDAGSGREVADELSRSFDVPVVSFAADVSRLDEVESAVAHTLEALGQIDVLVNNAGIIFRTPIGETSPDEWDQLIAINLKGPWLLARAVGPHMIARGSGKVVNISSVMDTIALSNRTVYGSSKGGLAQLTRALAAEWAPYNIQVNTVSPGVTLTDIQKELLAEDPAAYDEMLSKVPLGRPGEPEDVAKAVLFLASEAADYITGQLLHVDGGWVIT
jgi:NAD(P)-dependent dehydrogenase (short-subunit alcohol dehydrogenase family)